MRTILNDLEPCKFHYVIFDGKPGQTDLTYNIILASNYLYIPIEVSGADFLGLLGLNSFLASVIDTVKEHESEIGNWLDKLILIPYFYKASFKDSQRDLQAL